MTTLLVVLFPLALLAIVALTCFIGCSLSVTGECTDCSTYQDSVTGTAGLVAFWPLDDTSGTTATDIGPNNFNGTYTMGPDVPTYNAAEQSDASPGTYMLNAKQIVAGDASNPSVYFNGGYVTVPWQAALGPPQPMSPPLQFTLEAWVTPDWTLSDAQMNQSNRVVVASATGQSPLTGFALYAAPDPVAGNVWAAGVGVGTIEAVAKTGNNQPIVQGSLYFLVVTYDGTTLNLWVNPADTTQPADGSKPASGYVPVPSPIPFYIGQGRPDLPTPIYPFKGWIQDVAFYNVVLDGNTIQTHYMNGVGIQMM